MKLNRGPQRGMEVLQRKTHGAGRQEGIKGEDEQE